MSELREDCAASGRRSVHTDDVPGLRFCDDKAEMSFCVTLGFDSAEAALRVGLSARPLSVERAAVA